MVIAILVIVTVADLGLAALLINVSGFFFGAGPESMHGGSLAAMAYTAMVIACILAPSPDSFSSTMENPVLVYWWHGFRLQPDSWR